MDDLISRQAAIDALGEQPMVWTESDDEIAREQMWKAHVGAIKALPSEQPEYYDYSDIEPLWKYFAEENDINLTSTAKQLKDAMWCGYRKGKADAQPDLQSTCNQLATDCISRQAAIDALEKVAELFPWRVPGKRDTYDSYNEAWNDAIGRAEMEIEVLPSAQPIYTEAEIQKIQDLEQAQIEKAYQVGLEEGRAEQRWIPCSERLPKSNGVYIVSRWMSDGFETRTITDACYYDGSNTWHDDTRVNHGRKYVTDKIVAWMSLPEPYKEDRRETD